MDPVVLSLAALLMEGRRLHNRTVADADEVRDWHRAVDAALRLHHPEAVLHLDQEYDAPHRAVHRRFVNSLYKGF